MIKKGLFLVALVYTLALVVVTFIDLNGVPKLGSSFDDKIYHTLAYVGLGFLWLTYFKYIKSLKHTLPVFLVVLSFGILMELLQHQINANRTFDLVDLFSNCLGVSIGTIIAHFCNILKLKILKGLFILFIIN